MIAQLLNREYLLSELDATRNDLGRAIQDRRRRAGGPSRLDEVDTPELQALLESLRAVPDQPEGLAPAPGAPGEPQEVPPISDFAWIPRDPLLSNLQSALDEFYTTKVPDSTVQERLPDENRRGGAPGPIVTDTMLRAVPLRRTPSGRRVWGRFEVTRPKLLSDPRWVLSALAMGYRALHHRVPFPDTPPEPIEIDDDARILVVGDWGSALPRAQRVADRMAEELKARREDRRQRVVVHLGDVYYSGWEREYRERFLNEWPVDPGEDVMSFTLNGNHDMYCGGEGYFGACLRDPRFARQGGSSVFALRSPSWQLLALDSSYEDAALYGDQVRWVRERLDDAEGRKTLLMTHHNPFSAYEEGAPALLAAIQPLLDEGRIGAWLWGHEHRCLVYKPFRGLPFGSCIGHGGIPEYLVAREGVPYPAPPHAPLSYDYRRVDGEGLEPWETSGFAVVDLAGPEMSLHFIDEYGNPHHSTTVPVEVAA